MSRTSPLLRRVAPVVAPVLLALSLTGCGGDSASSSPDDASTEDFCGVLLSPPEALSGDDSGKAADAAHEWSDELREVGTPAELEADAREGYEVLVDALADVSADDIENADIGDLDGFVSDDDQAKLTSFQLTAVKLCAGSLGDLVPSDLPTDLPTDFPTDFPTDLPSDFPSDLLSDFPTDFPTDFPS